MQLEETIFILSINRYNCKYAVCLRPTKMIPHREKAHCCLGCFYRNVQYSLRGSSLDTYCLHDAKLNCTTWEIHTVHYTAYFDYGMNVIQLVVVKYFVTRIYGWSYASRQLVCCCRSLNGHHGGETYHHIAMLLNKTT